MEMIFNYTFKVLYSFVFGMKISKETTEIIVLEWYYICIWTYQSGLVCVAASVQGGAMFTDGIEDKVLW